jgi:hypothetical protein
VLYKARPTVHIQKIHNQYQLNPEQALNAMHTIILLSK